MTPKVVVFGIDGVRLDTLRATKTPHLDALARMGFLTKMRIPDENPTISGPCWATIASGVLSSVHKIKGNQLAGHALADNRCFLSRAADKGFTTYGAAGWLPLLTSQQDGPIFRPHTQYTPPRPPGSKTGGDSVSDGLVADEAAKALQHTDIDAAFIYFGQADDVGHAHGTGGAYAQAVRNTDACVGQVMTAISQRPQFDTETWTYVAVTDHGHRDGGGHGGDSDLERTAWIIAGGPGIDAGSGEGLNHADIPSLVAAGLAAT